MKTTMLLEPNQLFRVFHAPEVEIDGGDAKDFVDTALKCYLLWVDQYPTYTATLHIEGRPVESDILTRALFRSTRAARRTWTS